MKVIVKTLRRDRFDIEIEDTKTILDLKKKVHELHNLEPEHQKLIYSGKVLDNSNVIGETLKDGDFVVLATTHRAAQKPAAPEAPPAQSEEHKSEKEDEPKEAAEPDTEPKKEEEKKEEEKKEGAVPAVEPAASAPTTDPGTEYERTITQLCEMGFGRDQVIRALRAAFNNPERAVEYLFNGVPDGLDGIYGEGGIDSDEELAPGGERERSGGAFMPGPGAGPGFRMPGVVEAPGSAPGSGVAAVPQPLQPPPPTAPQPLASGALDFLYTNPQILGLRNMIQRNPQMLPVFLQTVSQNNPDLYRLIMENQDEFTRFINSTDGPASPAVSSGGSGGSVPASGPPAGGAPSGVGVSVTPEERAAIERLQELGFDRALVIQAYFACDKNEELAANWLLEHGYDS